MQVITKNFATAIMSLQETLGETQEAMARRIGCTLGAYAKWRRGERIPSGDWLIKILAFCPDDESRAAFGLAPVTQTEGVREVEGTDADLRSPGPSPLPRKQRRDLHEEMCTAIGLICERAPDQIVSDLACQIRRRAGTYGQPKSNK